MNKIIVTTSHKDPVFIPKVEDKPPKYQTVASLRGAAGSLTTPLAREELRQIAREDRLMKSNKLNNL